MSVAHLPAKTKRFDGGFQTFFSRLDEAKDVAQYPRRGFIHLLERNAPGEYDLAPASMYPWVVTYINLRKHQQKALR